MAGGRGDGQMKGREITFQVIIYECWFSYASEIGYVDCPKVASLNIGLVSIELKLGMLFIFEPF